MATRSNILAWKIPRAEEPGRLQSMGSVEATEPLSVRAAQRHRRAACAMVPACYAVGGFASTPHTKRQALLGNTAVMLGYAWALSSQF